MRKPAMTKVAAAARPAASTLLDSLFAVGSTALFLALMVSVGGAVSAVFR